MPPSPLAILSAVVTQSEHARRLILASQAEAEEAPAVVLFDQACLAVLDLMRLMLTVVPQTSAAWHSSPPRDATHDDQARWLSEAAGGATEALRLLGDGAPATLDMQTVKSVRSALRKAANRVHLVYFDMGAGAIEAHTGFGTPPRLAREWRLVLLEPIKRTPLPRDRRFIRGRGGMRHPNGYSL